MRFLIKEINDTKKIANSLAKVLAGNDILTLQGDLGAGKTTFVRALAEGLGIAPDVVSSPTFTIMQIYENNSGLSLCHFDAYRLKDSESFLHEGFNEYFSDGMVVCIEWPEIIAEALEALNADRLIIKITAERAMDLDFSAEKINVQIDNVHRNFEILANGKRAQEILDKWQELDSFPRELEV